MNKTFLNYDREILMICPNNYRDHILKWCAHNKKLLDISFMSKEEYFKRLFFSYGTDTLLYLVNEKKLSVRNARRVLADLLYINGDLNYGIQKLDELVLLYNELKEKDLLIFDPLFKDRLQRKHLIYAGYGLPDAYTKSLLTGKTIDIVASPLTDKKIEIVEFADDENEVASLYCRIAELLVKGVDIVRIHLLADESYDALLRRYNFYYPFEIEIGNSFSLNGTKAAQDFLHSLENDDRNTVYESLSKTGGTVSEKLINILNCYAGYELSDVRELIRDDVKNTRIDSGSRENIITRYALFDPIEDDEYLFVLGFDDKFAHFKRNDVRIDDTVRPLLSLPTIAEENELIRLSICGYLSNIANLNLSYAKKAAFASNGSPDLFEDAQITTDFKRYSLSEAGDRVAYAYALDDLRKFGAQNSELSDLYMTYGDNDYDSFDNRFAKIKNFNYEPSLSYSSMNSFYKCPFSYYLKHVLGVKDAGDTMYSHFGSLAHGLLKGALEDRECDPEELWFKLDSDYPCDTAMEKQFRLILKEELLEDVAIIRDQHQLTTLNKRLFENEFKTDDDGVLFKGYIDKLLYREDGNDVTFSLVDYKTGATDKIEEKLMPYGLSLQLPSYLYLLAKSEPFKDKKLNFGGIYLQHIISSDRSFKEDRTLHEQKRESMKLEGYSTSDVDRLKMVDTSLISEDKSEIIKSLAFKKGSTDFYAYSKVLSDEDVAKMIANVGDHIREAAKQIRDGEFKITSKVIEGKERSCAFCPYEDICFKRNGDTLYFDKEDA